MPVISLEAKAHELVGQLGSHKLAALVQLMEVMIHDDEPTALEPVTDEDRRRFQEGQNLFASGKGIPMEAVLAEFDLKPEDFPLHK